MRIKEVYLKVSLSFPIGKGRKYNDTKNEMFLKENILCVIPRNKKEAKFPALLVPTEMIEWMIPEEEPSLKEKQQPKEENKVLTKKAPVKKAPTKKTPVKKS